MAKNFSDVVQELGDVEQPLKADAIYGLSNLNEEDLKTLQAAWGAIPVERRRSLVQRLSEAAETNFDMDFDGVTRLALTDLDDYVREAAIETTWHDETADMATRLIAMASGDIAQGVRAAAVSALGRFILLGELGKFDPAVARRAENIAIKLYNDRNQDVNVRRRALEAIANCGREGVTQMIEQAYGDKNERMRSSAVHAMGSSYDVRWAKMVLSELDSEDPEMRYEAVRSAGELELTQAVPHLAEMLHDNDREILEMAIWALGEIGGEDARDLLETEMERADEQGDESLAEAIEEALESANLASHDLAL